MNKDLFYDISMPKDLQDGKTYPVIYAMHGRGSNEQDIMSLVKELKEEFIIVGVRGPLILHAGFEYFTIKSFGNPNIDSFDEAIIKLENFIEQLPSQYPIDISKQFLLGFSQGAILSMSLVLKMGNKIKGIVALSGYIPKHFKETYTLKSVSELSIFIAHGEFDFIFPLNIGEENHEFFEERTKQLVFNTYPIGHEVSLNEKEDIQSWLQTQI
jgi:phospholipase/carboxylesterase